MRNQTTRMRRRNHSVFRRLLAVFALVTVSIAGLIVPATPGTTPVARADNGSCMTPGNLIVSDGDHWTSPDDEISVTEYTPDGTFVHDLITTADGLYHPGGSAFDGQGNLFVTDFVGHKIYRVDHSTCAVTIFSDNTILGDGYSYALPWSIAFSSGYTDMYVTGAGYRNPGSTVGFSGIQIVDPVTGEGKGWQRIPGAIFTSGQVFLPEWLAFNSAGQLFMTNGSHCDAAMEVDLSTGEIIPSNLETWPDRQCLEQRTHAIAFDKQDNLWLANNWFIGQYDPSGKQLKQIHDPEIPVAYALAFNPVCNTLYVGDLLTGHIGVFDPTTGTKLRGFKIDDGNYFRDIYALSVVGGQITCGQPGANLSPSSHNFGALRLDRSSAPEQFTVTSTGAATLEIASLSFAGGNPTNFSISNDTCTGASLEPTQACTFDVTFNPVDTGPLLATLHVNSNAARAPESTLSGNTHLPVVTVSFPAAPPDQFGWFNGDDLPVVGSVTASDPTDVAGISCEGADLGAVSGYGTTSASGPLSVTGSDAIIEVSCTATNGVGTTGRGPGSDAFAYVRIDITPPVISDTGFVSGTPGLNGWYVSPVTHGFSAIDYASGIRGCANVFSGNGITFRLRADSGTEQGSAVTISSGACLDFAGNVNPGIDSDPYKIDYTPPYDVTFVGGGVTDGASYHFGFVPAGPTGCSAMDDVSGFDHCIIDGYDTSVGTHTLTATAYDVAGNSEDATLTYTVLAWTLDGFFPPVRNTEVNTVKAGRTVPLKFAVYAGSTELTDTNVVSEVTATPVVCGDTTDADPVPAEATGGTSLRHAGRQFIFNWKVPEDPGSCYLVRVTTADGSSIAAQFKLR